MIDHSNLVIICARGGSKGIPSKNIKSFNGKPLIAWAIESALGAKNVSRVLVSTDSGLIRDVAIKYGAEAPFLRPEAISTDKVPLEPVLSHALEWLRDNEDYSPDSVTLIPATNPLRKSVHIDDCIAMFYETNADNVMTVHESPANYTPYWSVTYCEKKGASFYGGLNLRDGHTQRQAFPDTIYARNDIAYTFRPDNLSAPKPSIYGEYNEILVMDRIYDGDINTEADWELTEKLFIQSIDSI
jgi:CMP-N,N'-diacetyllegionaminic acid synthase